MRKGLWLGGLAAVGFAASLAAPGLPVPGAERLGLIGSAAAQEAIDIDSFYDALDPYGQWVWHPRYGYVWLPEDVSPNWRPYTVGRWTYTDEYGWYWDSYEPFAWAVYHYGRWGYDPDYGWFWVPGDTWAPAWVQWRYSDNYVGWAPIGPRRNGYAYGVPVNYDPPIAESWVFVQPRYLTSRAISHYALPIGALGPAFLAATDVYRPQYRNGIVYNYGMPRDRVVKITRRPVYVQKIYKVNNWKAEGFDKKDFNKGIRIYAPGFNKNGGNRGPKRFADHPNDFKPKAKLKDTYKGDLPKGWGDSAKGLKSIAKEDPDAFSKKHGKFGPDDEANRGDNNRDNKDKNQASKGNDNDKDNKGNRFRPDGGSNASDQFKQGKSDNDKNGSKGDNDKNNKNNKNGGNNNANNDAKSAPPPPPAPPPIVKGGGKGGDDQKGLSAGGANPVKQGSRDNDKGNGNKDNKGENNKNKAFGNQGGPGGPGGGGQFNQFKQGNRDNNGDKGDRGDSNNNNNKNKNKNFGDQGGGGANQFKQGNQGAGGGTRPSGPPQFKQGGGGGEGGGGNNNQRAQGGNGGGGGDNDNKDKCKKHPEKCQNPN